VIAPPTQACLVSVLNSHNHPSCLLINPLRERDQKHADLSYVAVVAGLRAAHIEAGRAIIACLLPQLLHKRDMPVVVTSAFVAWWGRLPGFVCRRLLPHLLKHLGVPKEVMKSNNITITVVTGFHSRD
jgi:hypothetical protein